MRTKVYVEKPYVCNECGHEFAGKEYQSAVSAVLGDAVPSLDNLYFFNPCPHCGSNHTYPKGLLQKLGISGIVSNDRRDKWKEWDEYGPGGKPYDGPLTDNY